MNRIEHLKKKVSILLIVGLLLAAIPMTAFAEKGQAGGGSGSATPSSAEKVEEDGPDDEDASDEEDVSDDADVTDKEDISDATPSEADREDEEDEEDEEFEEEFRISATPSEALPLPEEEPDLTGIWTLDGVTSYQFDEDGDGALLLPEKKYGFTYTLDGDQLSIDFASKRASDGTYTVTMDGDRLILEGGKGTIGATFEFEKIDEVE
ncbi:MAG: DUF5640 domain-containing protein [Clostridiaceae bacterium]|nr:DUF5640 domain-containing protein [Clostridiaceae bacterium]